MNELILTRLDTAGHQQEQSGASFSVVINSNPYRSKINERNSPY
ncbi:MAG: hypothetical protein U0Z53_24020 [Blastocatellia bacterium]